MKVTVDAAGRVLVPKALRDQLGMRPGTEVDVFRYGGGLQLVPGGRTARLVERDGLLVATGDGSVDDDDVFRLVDDGRR